MQDSGLIISRIPDSETAVQGNVDKFQIIIPIEIGMCLNNCKFVNSRIGSQSPVMGYCNVSENINQ